MGIKRWLEAPVREVAAPSRPAVNWVRGALARVTTPLLPDDYLHLANPLWSARELRGQILEVKPETADSVTLVIKPGWGFSFDYQAGQYIGIGLLMEGRWRWRSYSLTSAPTRGQRTITISVKAMPEGFLSTHLVNGVDPGTIVRLAAPQGNFALPAPAPSKILFITAGSGITPVMSMLRALDRHGEFTDVCHIHSSPTEADIMFAAELRELGSKYSTLRQHFQLTRTQGKFPLSSLDVVCPDWRERQTWACGPTGLLDQLEKLWAGEGVADKLHTERFAISRASSGEQGGTVRFAKSDKTVVADGATTLLEAGEQVGVQMPFGCRMGICQTCVTTLTEGTTRDLRNGKEHEVGDRIQTCVSAAAGDCTLEV